MDDLKQREVWFLTGSQELYGPAALKQVAANAGRVVGALDRSKAIPVKVVSQPVVKSAADAAELCRRASQAPECVGVITWCHTFSPSKMWIQGLKLLRQPLLHFHTQHHRDIPWSTIDMDFMNLNQAAHGDREHGFIMSRMRLNRKVVVGHWQEARVAREIGAWARAAAAWADWQGARFVRFGDNMREVAVTEGDKVAAQMQLGYSVNTHGVGDLVSVISRVTDREVAALVEEYESRYAVAPKLRRKGAQRKSLLEAD
jgi:L-arabinose isomerase